MIERGFLILCGAVFLAFGFAMLLEPISILASMGIDVSGRHGIFEMRGIYGGVSLGIALLCLLAAFINSLRKGALLTLLAYCGGYIIARIFALIVDGSPEPIFYTFIAWEAFVAIVAGVFLRGKTDQN